MIFLGGYESCTRDKEDGFMTNYMGHNTKSRMKDLVSAYIRARSVSEAAFRRCSTKCSIFTGKHQCWSLILLKRDSTTGVFL